MKLIRFGEPGEEKPGVELDCGKKIDASGFGEDYDENFFANEGLKRLGIWLKRNSEESPIISKNSRIAAPICRPSKLICVGLNYAKHAVECGAEVPKEPVLFFKSTSAITGPYDNVIIPKGSEKTDWEVELGIVIGKKASYVSEEDANDYIAGYVLHNDVSERGYQIEQGGQWCKGKGCDTFAPIEPYLVTKDEVKDPNNLRLWLDLNGERLQNSTTADFIFKVEEVVSYISQFMTLLPGDIISTGTPAGVGHGLKPPKYLQPGDVMELGVDGLGNSKQKAVAYK